MSLDLLSKYKNDIQRKERLQNERDQMLKEHLPEMKKNEMDMEEIKKQLQDIEQQLGMTRDQIIKNKNI